MPMLIFQDKNAAPADGTGAAGVKRSMRDCCLSITIPG